MEIYMNIINKLKKWQKRYFRIRLGILQLIHKPLLNLFFIVPVLVFILLIHWKSQVLTAKIPDFFLALITFLLELSSVFIPLSLIIVIIALIGVLSAINDEANIEIAFSHDELRNGCPILINKKIIKGTDVTEREFFSNIPLRIWNKKIEE